MIGGENFACGSSREAAVWALKAFGIRCVIAPSFGTIFFSNCFQNGVLPVVVPAKVVEELAAEVEATQGKGKVTIDLKRCVVISPSGKETPFTIDALLRQGMLEGLDQIELTRAREPQIAAFQARDRAQPSLAPFAASPRLSRLKRSCPSISVAVETEAGTGEDLKKKIWEETMGSNACKLLTGGIAIAAFALAVPPPAAAQKQGGTLRIYNSSNPPSASPHEDTTIAVVMPFMAVYNNLVRYDPIKPRNSFDTIIPELATSWEWDATKTKLTFKLRSDVTWHDGKPFTGKDVQCTFHRLNGKEPDYLRRNPRGIWYENLTEVTLNGDYEVTFNLSKPQPSLLAMLASGYTAVYPCHVSGRDMRVKPIGTGPFKFVEFKSNESIRLVKNPDYWKKGQPYLDAIEWRIVPSRSTRLLAFAAGEFDLTQTADVTPPLLNDVKKNAPNAMCAMLPTNVTTHMLVNREKPPFDNPELRRAMITEPRPSGVHRHLDPRQGQPRREHDAAT